MEHIDKITERTKLEPVYNGFQYLFVFLFISLIITPILYFFSSRKYNAMKAQPPQDVFGFAPEIYPIFRSLGKYKIVTRSPELSDTVYDRLITGSLVFGIIGVLLILIVDIILQIIKSSREDS
jgi:hypothetical protein